MVLKELSSKERTGDKRMLQPSLRKKMETSLKGAGKLSRKILTILTLAAMPMLGYAVDNSIFIDQAGSNAVINITQDGAGNTVKGLTSSGQPGQRGIDAATITGDNNQIAVTQVGSGNTLSLGVAGGTMNGYANTQVTYSATAANSSALINVNGLSNRVGVTQTGDNSSVETRVIGGRNNVSINAAGSGDSVRAGIQGGDSTINVNLTNTGGSNTVTATTDSGNIGINADGTGNTFNVQQTGFGNTAKIAGYTTGDQLSGNDNNVNIRQDGSGNLASVGITGSTNYVAINQGSGSDGHEAKVKINGSGNSVNISQGTATSGTSLLALPVRAQ